MRELADGVWQLDGFPPNNVNAYVLGRVLIDAGLAFERRRILSQVAGRGISTHALTHAHLDHFGSSHAVCEYLGVAAVCGDVMWGCNPFLLKPGIREPYHWASPDPERNRASARRLAALEPALVCFGHGPPVRDTAAFTAAVARLSRE